MFPATTTLQKFTKREQERAASCRPGGSADVAGRGRPATSAGQGGGGPRSGPSPPLPPRPGAGPWEDTGLGPRGLKDGPSPRMPGSWPHGGGGVPGEAVARERAGQSFRTRLGAQTGLLGLPAPRLRRAATGSHVSTQSLIKGGLCPVLAPGSTSSRPTHLDAEVELIPCDPRAPIDAIISRDSLVWAKAPGKPRQDVRRAQRLPPRSWARARPFFGKCGLWAHGVCRVNPFLHSDALTMCRGGGGAPVRRSPGAGEWAREASDRCPARPTQGQPTGARTPAATSTLQVMRGGQTGSRSPNARPTSHRTPTWPPEGGGPSLRAALKPCGAGLCGCGLPQSPPGYFPRLHVEFGLDRSALHGGRTARPRSNPPRPPEKSARDPFHCGRCSKCLQGPGGTSSPG
uniref:transcription initiation factor TFIID subunit 4-like n=1 Tax=Halichoerus grypus TaxID=9711 RepID=UPI0016598071|nr:transcription initiation factor TFIID subunit 4-like [Halichoerus grypus]